MAAKANNALSLQVQYLDRKMTGFSHLSDVMISHLHRESLTPVQAAEQSWETYKKPSSELQSPGFHHSQLFEQATIADVLIQAL